ncbi:hypothetical protein [Zobellella iuensis]|uniref:Uncharacterized protein n=1 Tax=Zobellella iuensis TaxID=2803811 RepID=A0ABS1QVE4_9GAMM|nr:hypothetical protein [Zobellella iuensis]MBL1378512.1 hypothetical protein [Zobellella iuensis]
MTKASLLLPILLLTGCTAMELPFTPGNQQQRVSSGTPGIAVSRTQPPRLESISFLSERAFVPTRAQGCITELIPPAGEDAEVIRYLGEDVLNAGGEIAATGSQWGIIPSQYHIRFQLSALAHHNGTTYGFNRISLAQEDAWGLNNHDFEPLPPSGARTQKVYNELQALYRRLDECLAEPSSARHRKDT